MSEVCCGAQFLLSIDVHCGPVLVRFVTSLMHLPQSVLTHGDTVAGVLSHGDTSSDPVPSRSGWDSPRSERCSRTSSLHNEEFKVSEGKARSTPGACTRFDCCVLDVFHPVNAYHTLHSVQVANRTQQCFTAQLSKYLRCFSHLHGIKRLHDIVWSQQSKQENVIRVHAPGSVARIPTLTLPFVDDIRAEPRQKAVSLLVCNHHGFLGAVTETSAEAVSEWLAAEVGRWDCRFIS
eukprot:gene13027-biopygen3927